MVNGSLFTGIERCKRPRPPLSLAFATVRDFRCEPHTGIVGEHLGTIMNLVDRQAQRHKKALLEVVREHPDATLRKPARLCVPTRHEVHASDVDLKRLGAFSPSRTSARISQLRRAPAAGKKLGPRTLQTLSLVAKSFTERRHAFDPARFSFALGERIVNPFRYLLRRTMNRSLFSTLRWKRRRWAHCREDRRFRTPIDLFRKWKETTSPKRISKKL